MSMRPHMLSASSAQQRRGNSATPIPAQCVHHLFEEQVARSPDAVAVIDGSQQVSYAELETRANRLAHHLRELGVGPEVVVGICLERGVQMVLAVLGVLKAGGAYLPLDPTYPSAQLAFMLHDSGAPVLLTTRSLVQRLPVSPVRRVHLDSVRFGGRPCVPLGVPVNADHLAYVLYTSGSTGRPKGVCMPHGSLVNLLMWQRSQFSPECATTLQFAPLSFDASFHEILSTLSTGGRLVLISEQVRQDPEQVLRLVADNGVTRLFLTFTALRQLVSAAWTAPLSACLQEVIASGEALQITRDIAVWFARLGGCRLYNYYGPTETHVVTAFSLAGRPGTWPTSPPIGRAIEGVTVHVCDDLFNPVADGDPGELYIGGAALARGYLGRAALTAERFVPDPFGESGARLYRTGDLVRRLPDGNLEFLGRIDNQVKIRGFRIEPGEIEAVLAEHPDVAQAAVVARDDACSDRRLVAYVVPGSVVPSVVALRAHLGGRLPAYMVPAAFVTMEALPLTPSGKVDRQALPSPSSEVAGEDEVTRPRSVVETVLCELWSALLGVNSVPVDADFFDLGGHSILATRVMAHVREVFQVEVSLRVLFEAPTRTVGGLAVVVERELCRGPKELGPPLTAVQHNGPLPLSYPQQRLWFMDRLAPGSPFFNVTAAFRVRGHCEVDALRHALDGVVARHDVLRTRFESSAGVPQQLVEESMPVQLTLTDVGHVPIDRREAEAKRLIKAEADRCFDLAHGPLLRTGLIQLTPQEHVFWVTMHHIVCDGWSLEIFFRELSALYHANVTGEPPSLPPLPVQYADYAIWQRTALGGERSEAQVAYWRKRLDGVSAQLPLPTDRPRPASPGHQGAAHILQVDGGLADALRQLSRAQGTTLYMTLLAAFQILLSRWTTATDIVVGTPLASRTHAKLEALIGFFDNTVAVRTDLSDDPSFQQLLARVRRHTLGAYAHQDLPFEQLVEYLQAWREPGRNPLFQILFAMQNAPQPHLGIGDAEHFPVNTASSIVGFDLMCSCTETGKKIKVTIEYSTDLFDTATIERLGAHYLAILRAVTTDPGICLTEILLLDEAERQDVLALGSGDHLPLAKDACAHHLVEEQAAHTPEAIATEDDRGQLTYAELDRRANQLAHHLQTLGVGPESVVAVCLIPSSELTVAILAVWKAGGAFLPLDPQQPLERLHLIANDAQARVLLTRINLFSLLGGMVDDLTVCCLDRDVAVIAERSEHPVVATVVPDNLACVFYTSGSTGVPKGVMFIHRALVSYTGAVAKDYGLRPGDRFLQLSSIGFDVLIEETIPVLATGGTIVFPRDRALATGIDFTRYLDQHSITCVELTTAYWHEWVSELIGSGRQPPPALRLVVMGGERVLPERWAQWQQFGTPVLHIYGLTEATVTSTVFRPGEVDRSRCYAGVPIGRPIANTRVHVLDTRLEPVPLGVPGELYIGGIGPARGYLGRPAATAERFVPDPFATKPGQVLYRTGDLALLRADGNLEFLGRIDHAAKIRGHRIEPGEVESVLVGHPAVREALVVVCEDRGDKQLIAYVSVRDDDTERTTVVAALRGLLRRRLPAYMVPSAIVVLNELPLNAHGKVDRDRLPQPGRGELDVKEAITAPRNATESQLTRIVADLLGLDLVGIHDNFFDLGGHSLLAVRLAAQIREATGVEVPVYDLFGSPTVAELAMLVATRHHQTSTSRVEASGSHR